MNRADNAMTTVLKYFIGTYAIVSFEAIAERGVLGAPSMGIS